MIKEFLNYYWNWNYVSIKTVYSLACSLLGKYKESLNILESNLNDIISPFLQRLSIKNSKLTTAQIQVANLVKEGKTTKEIADLLGLSQKTIEDHRKSIRKKLGILGKNINLKSFLTQMQ